MKIFQSDGGTKFVNTRVSTLLTKNATHHMLSCLTPLNRMVEPNANTNTSLRQVLQCSLMQVLLLLYGSMLSVLQLILSIDFHLNFLITKVLLSYCIIHRQVMMFFMHLDAQFIFIYDHIMQTN